MRLRFGKVHVKQFDAYVWCGMAQLVNKVDKLTMQAMLVATHGCSTTKEGGAMPVIVQPCYGQVPGHMASAATSAAGVGESADCGCTARLMFYESRG